MDPSNSRVERIEDILHWAICDNCSADPIKGLRFRCQECYDFDLCGECYAQCLESHDSQHIFLQIPGGDFTLVTDDW
jgi:Zinc finger, ZZ type